jgi:hypothetical protein
MDGIDPTLSDAIAQGTYMVDPSAVADAIMRRHGDLIDARRLSEVLVAAKLDERAASVPQRHPGAGADVA